MTRGRAAGAFEKALELLAVREHFRAELEEKLVRRGFGQPEIEAALERCERLGYLDDRRAAERFVEVHAVRKGWGRRRLEQELRRRGAPAEVIAGAAAISRETEVAALGMALHRAESRARPG